MGTTYIPPAKDQSKNKNLKDFAYSKEEAKDMLIKISEKYSKEIVKYNPQVSERIRSRR